MGGGGCPRPLPGGVHGADNDAGDHPPVDHQDAGVAGEVVAGDRPKSWTPVVRDPHYGCTDVPGSKSSEARNSRTSVLCDGGVYARLRSEQVVKLADLARRLQRNRRTRTERITVNTVLRVAVGLGLDRAGDFTGSTEVNFGGPSDSRSPGIPKSGRPMPAARPADDRLRVVGEGEPLPIILGLSSISESPIFDRCMW